MSEYLKTDAIKLEKILSEKQPKIDYFCVHPLSNKKLVITVVFGKDNREADVSEFLMLKHFAETEGYDIAEDTDKNIETNSPMYYYFLYPIETPLD